MRRMLDGKKKSEMMARYRPRAAPERREGREEGFDTPGVLAAQNLASGA